MPFLASILGLFTEYCINRSKNALSEGREPDLLCFNTLLPYLAHLLNTRAFRDFSTIEELLAYTPPEYASAAHMPWREDLLEEPFFVRASGGRIETAGAFGKRNADAGIRAGLFPPPTMHDWRAYTLYKIGKFFCLRKDLQKTMSLEENANTISWCRQNQLAV
jgi:hypothetical protein